MQARNAHNGFEDLHGRPELCQIVGQSLAFVSELKKIPTIANCDANVLITGETGTGKGMVARAIHNLSRRSSAPFVALNCGAIPAALVENELFGHRAGAYTGASSTVAGHVAQAEGGTLFLDEINSLPWNGQTVLLELCDEKSYRALGCSKRSNANIRIVAASNGPLDEAIKEGRFRQDLFYRLNVIGLKLPPLRERSADVMLLAKRFLAVFALELNKPCREFTAGAAAKLMAWKWPGNVRELQNIVHRAALWSEGPSVPAEHVELPETENVVSTLGYQEERARAIAVFEKEYLTRALATFGSSAEAARQCGIAPRYFYMLKRKHSINGNDHNGYSSPEEPGAITP